MQQAPPTSEHMPGQSAPERHIHYADVATPEIVLRRTDKYLKLLRACEGLQPAYTPNSPQSAKPDVYEYTL